MYIIIITPTQDYITDIRTLTLYTSQGKTVAQGFLRIMAAMCRKHITALEKYDFDGNLTWDWHEKESRKMFA